MNLGPHDYLVREGGKHPWSSVKTTFSELPFQVEVTWESERQPLMQMTVDAESGRAYTKDKSLVLDFCVIEDLAKAIRMLHK
jgi:hypothetical protein